jgi:alpha-acetolactate decarboxylase
MATLARPQHKTNVPLRTTNAKLEGMFESARNTPLSLRLRGTFAYMHIRGHTLFDMEGTVFGFCTPSYQAGLSGNGVQCAFLNASKTKGGPGVGEFVTGLEAILGWSRCDQLHYNVSQDDEFDELRL